MTAKIQSKNKVYEGEIFDLSHYEILLQSGKSTRWDVVEHKGACMIIPVTNDGHIVMVRQYRVGANAEVLELPAGKLDLGEDPEKCALRELAEETGYRAGKIKLLTKVHPLAAYCTELIHVFLAEDLKLGETNLDEGEFVETEIYNLSDLLKMIDKGEIIDMKTVMGVLMYARTRDF